MKTVVNICLSNKQMKMREERCKRQFRSLKSIETLVAEIEKASSIHDLEKTAMREGICDYCDLTSLKFDAAVSFMRTAVTVLHFYPKLRSRLNFVGSIAGCRRMIERLYSQDRDLIRQLGIESVCSDKTVTDITSALEKTINGTDYANKKNNALAAAIGTGGFIDSVILDENDFKGLGYAATVRDLEEMEKIKYHPQGCSNLDSVFFHEFGHMLDNLTGTTSDKKFENYFRRFRKDEITDRLSKYASTDMKEFFAEAFAEYMCSKAPREVSVFTMKLFEAKYYSE